jgi:hypothetical protein
MCQSSLPSIRVRERPALRWSIATTRYLSLNPAIGSIHTAGADGFDGLCRQNASSERSPPGVKIISGKPPPCTS